jgi:uncharacterized protein YciI
MKFAVIVDYDAADPNVPVVRPAHREYLSELRANGKLVISGPFTEGGGALIVMEADTKEEVAALMAADPFVKKGVFKTWVVRPWNPIFVNRNLLPE